MSQQISKELLKASREKFQEIVTSYSQTCIKEIHASKSFSGFIRAMLDMATDLIVTGIRCSELTFEKEVNLDEFLEDLAKNIEIGMQKLIEQGAKVEIDSKGNILSNEEVKKEVIQ